MSAPRTASRFVIVGNPENRRVTLFQQALAEAALPAATVVSYADLLAGKTRLIDHLKPGVLLRIESPGENFEVECGLLRCGAAAAATEGTPFLPADCCDSLEFDLGLILHPRQWYLGFRSLLRQFQTDLADIGGVHVMNSLEEIEVMFDKRLTHARCADGGIPVPGEFGPVSCYDELLAIMDRDGVRRVFVKLANGSSASGVVALRYEQGQHIAVTTVEIDRSGGDLRLYNSLRLRRYCDPAEIAAIIDALCREQVIVEQWLPKYTPDEHGNIDLRIVVINGEAQHCVVRQSRSPLTNLHLGNRRGDLGQLLQRLGPQRWEELRATCAAVMKLFPDSLYAGLDLLLDPGLSRHVVLEVNAFGDLLPGVTHQGRDTYAAEIAAAVSQDI